MKISLPPAKWHKHVGRILNLGTTGFDWKSNPGQNEFVASEAALEVDAGDLFVSFNIGRAVEEKGATIFWMAVPIRNSLVFLDESHSDTTWSVKFVNRARTLLAMPANARVIYGLDRRLEELFRSPDRGAGAMAVISEATRVRATYASRLNVSSADLIDEVWIKAAFESFLTEQSRYSDISRERLLALLQDSYTQLTAAAAPPSPIQPRRPRVAGRRPIQLRNQREHE